MSWSFSTFSEIQEELPSSFQASCLGQCDLPLSLHLRNCKTYESTRSSCLIQDTESNLGSLGWGLRGCISHKLQGLPTRRSVGHALGNEDLDSLGILDRRTKCEPQPVVIFSCLSFALTRKHVLLEQTAPL